MTTGTLIEGLNEKMIQAKINEIDVKPFLFARLFPVKKINFFQWKSLMNQAGPRNVAADISADNASVIRKSRPRFQTAMGDLPLLTISRDKKRSEIKEYQIALALAGDPTATELVEYWAEDVEFCFKGIQWQLEYIALALASNAGVLSFNNANNAAVATEFDLDYEVADEQKKTTSIDFANSSTADFIGTVNGAAAAGDALGLNIKYMYANKAEVAKIIRMDQVIKACASFAANVLDIQQVPSLEMVNSMLMRQPLTNGIQIVLVDQKVDRELADGSFTSSNPFADNRLLFSESPVLGSTQYSNLLNNKDTTTLRAVRAHTVVKKYGVTEPYSEVTLAEADALPVFDTAYRNLYYKTDATSW